MNSPKASLSKGDTSSAYGSPTFNLNMSIKVDAPVGSMWVLANFHSFVWESASTLVTGLICVNRSISPSSRDVVLAS